MGRAKLSLVPITRERYRNTTFQKRKAGLFKKAEEFSILCGVDACVIVYGPQPKRNGTVRAEADTYPKDINKVQRIIRRSAGNCRGKHTQDLSDFFQARKKKIDREISKQRARNWRAEYYAWDTRLDGLPENQLRQLASVLEAKLEEAARVKLMRTGAKEASHFAFNDMIDVGGYENYLLHNNYFTDIPYIDGGLFARAMGKRQEMETEEEQPRTVPMIVDPQSSMLMLMNNVNIDSTSYCGSSNNNFQYYASQMGLYNKYNPPLLGDVGVGGGGDSTVASSSTGNNFQYYAPLLGNGGVESAANFQYFTALLGAEGGVSSDANNLQYSTWW